MEVADTDLRQVDGYNKMQTLAAWIGGTGFKFKETCQTKLKQSGRRDTRE